MERDKDLFKRFIRDGVEAQAAVDQILSEREIKQTLVELRLLGLIEVVDRADGKLGFTPTDKGARFLARRKGL